jgi:hypothetical protein
VKTLKAVVGTQQGKRSCGLGESFVHELRSIRINLAPRRRVEWFSHSLGQIRTWRDVLPESVMLSKADISETLLMNLDV